ncbi:MAG: hypothetical protein E7384_06490 [Ruminococcaceae bacterium]|nr:hypothetical protein [Oscillospiraceae bacterium]
MITFEDFTKMFSVDLNGKMCIEIEFNIIGYPNYQYCWMGKMPIQRKTKLINLQLFKKKNARDIYWFGLPNKEQESYDYDNFENFCESSVFNGRSLKELWDYVELLSIDGCDPDERIKFYLNYSIK